MWVKEHISIEQDGNLIELFDNLCKYVKTYPVAEVVVFDSAMRYLVVQHDFEYLNYCRIDYTDVYEHNNIPYFRLKYIAPVIYKYQKNNKGFEPKIYLSNKAINGEFYRAYRKESTFPPMFIPIDYAQKTSEACTKQVDIDIMNPKYIEDVYKTGAFFELTQSHNKMSKEEMESARVAAEHPDLL